MESNARLPVFGLLVIQPDQLLFSLMRSDDGPNPVYIVHAAQKLAQHSHKSL